MSAITRYLAMLRLFGMLLCAAAIPSVATATVAVTVAVAASDVEEEAVEASAVGAEAEAARDAGYESAEVPALARRVTDLTATLDAAERARLEASLAALEARKGAQVAILMVPSTYPDSIEAYATRVFEAWKRGARRGSMTASWCWWRRTTGACALKSAMAWKERSPTSMPGGSSANT